MIDKSEREKRAIKDARKYLAEAIMEIGIMEHFWHLPPEKVDQVIEACIDGFRESMLNQTCAMGRLEDDEIPF